MSGVFGLGEVRTEQIDRTWSESANYGYFAGGDSQTPDEVCTIDRMDFSSETVSLPASSLSAKRYGLAAVSSSNYGYFGGGEGPTRFCRIDRLDFSTETAGLTANLTQARRRLGGVSSSDYGYFLGGTSPIGTICTIDRIEFSSDTVSLRDSELTQKRTDAATVSTPNYGYMAAGRDPAILCSVDRIDFSNETVAIVAHLPQRRYSLAGASSSDYGYFAGGFAPPWVNTIDRIDFSNETTAAPGNNIDLAGNGLSGISNLNYGYFGGGGTATRRCAINRIDFSNETVTAPGTYQLTQARKELAGVSGGKSINSRGVRKGTDKDGKGISSTYGYFGGGSTPPGPTVATIDRIDFSNHTTSAPGNNLTQARYGVAVVSNSNYGYIAGGFESNWYATIDRLDFSNETVVGPSAHGANLIQARAGLAAVSNSNYGYFAGGERFDFECTIDRLDFSTETVAVPSVGDELTKARQFLGAVSNSNYGYFGGGRTPPTVVTIDRIDFSTETVSLPGNNLTQARSGIAGVFSSNYGYFGGGFDGSRFCTIDRIDFSNETVVGPPVHGANLTQARNSVAGVSGRQTRIRRTTDKTGSSVSGYGFYLMNGLPSGSAPGQRNIIDYATETQTTPPTDMAGTAQPHGSIFTSIDYGYQVKTGTTILDRYEFKNDTRSALDKLSAAGTGSSFSNNHYGYSTRQNETNGNRYDKSTDTDTIIANIISVSTTRTPSGVANFSSPYYGWFSMGQTPGLPPVRASIIDRLEFSTETTSIAPVPTTYRVQGTAGGKDLVGSYGYIFGGNGLYTSSYLNVANKFDMETETFSPGGTYCPAPVGRMDLTVGLSKHYGYIGPGYRPPTTLNRMDRYEFSTNTSTSPSTTMSSPSVRASHCFPSDIAV